MTLRAPFPWFGGKSRAAHLIWERLGDPPNYVEPFAGSLAVLLGRPTPPRIETINDLDCFVANFWRALAQDPEQVAHHADWPVNEADLHARHTWLVGREAFRERMKTDPDFFDAKIAGFWVWGLCQWIGGDWCVGFERRGRTNEGRRARGIHAGGIWRKRPKLGGNGVGCGVHRSRPNLGSSNGVHGTRRQLPAIAGRGGRGINSTVIQPAGQIPDISGDGGAAGRWIHASGRRGGIHAWFEALAERLRPVRVCCGDWQRILGPAPTTCIGVTAVVLDPPYSDAAGRDAGLYAQDSLDVAHRVREWAIANGDDPKLRIALCGYDTEHTMPDSWEVVAWKAAGGYGGQRRKGENVNRERERIWFSPHCRRPAHGLQFEVPA